MNDKLMEDKGMARRLVNDMSNGEVWNKEVAEKIRKEGHIREI